MLMTLPAHYTEHIINSLPGVFYIFDSSGRLLLWNKNLECISGYNENEIRNMHVLDFFEVQERERIYREFNKTLSDGPSAIEADLINKEGKLIPYLFSGESLRMEGGTCLIGLGVDISKRRRTEQRLKESEERHRMIVELAQEGIWMIDKNNITTFANNRIAQILGYTREEMIGLPLHHFMDEDEKSVADRNVEKRKLGISEQHEFMFRKKNGDHVWTLLNTNPIFNDGIYQGALAMVTDISARKEAERKLQESEQKFRSLVQNSSDIITVHDAERRYTYVSPAITGTLGYNPDFFIGKDVIDFIYTDDRDVILEAFREVLEKGIVSSVTYRVLHQSGELRWLESRARNMLNEPGICGLVINTRDVTDRVQLQKALDLQNIRNQKEITTAVIRTQETERSQIGRELHDNINQVLTTIKLYNEMLRDGLGDPRELIGKSMRHLQDCIDEIRSISKRLSAPTIGRISLNDSIKELINSINLTKRLEISFTMRNPDNIPVSQELHLAVYRIVQEKLNNILKYAEATEASIKIEVNEQILELEIRDNGKGFDVNKTAHSGIGITNMKTRAENLNGTFLIESMPGKGCVVRVRIPVDGDEDQEP